MGQVEEKYLTSLVKRNLIPSDSVYVSGRKWIKEIADNPGHAVTTNSQSTFVSSIQTLIRKLGDSVDYWLAGIAILIGLIMSVYVLRRISVYWSFGIVSSVIIFTTTVYLYLNKMQIFLAYFIAVNLTTFIMYGYDKVIASSRKSRKSRVPELILHILAFIGGSPFALVAQWHFRHKTVKEPFRSIYWAIVFMQAVGIWYFFNY